VVAPIFLVYGCAERLVLRYPEHYTLGLRRFSVAIEHAQALCWSSHKLAPRVCVKHDPLWDYQKENH